MEATGVLRGFADAGELKTRARAAVNTKFPMQQAAVAAAAAHGGPVGSSGAVSSGSRPAAFPLSAAVAAAGREQRRIRVSPAVRRGWGWGERLI